MCLAEDRWREAVTRGMRRLLFHTACNDARSRDPVDPELREALLATSSALAAGAPVPYERVDGTDDTIRLSPLVEGRSLVWRDQGESVLLLWVDVRPAAINWAQRFHLVADGGASGAPELVELDESGRQLRTYAEVRSAAGPLLLAWTDDELLQMGFSEGSIEWLRDATTPDDIDELKPVLIADEIDRVRELVASGKVRLAPLAPRPTEAQPSRDGQISFSELGGSIIDITTMEDVLARPIEDWMVFLHPLQQEIVKAPVSGPTKISGPAGSGKTVIAIHKAVDQAFAGTVLVTTLVRNLPPVFEQLSRRLSPTSAERIQFLGLFAWAYRYLEGAGVPFRLDGDRIEGAFGKAWHSARKRGDRLVDRVVPKYAKDEIDWVIKPRQLDLEGYLKTDRQGRGVAMDEALRRQMWQICSDYQENLGAAGIVDFNDLFAMALERVTSTRDASFDLVVVDEAQDVNELGLRLAHALCGEAGRLLLVADERQSLYPARVVLSRIGINVVGRSRRLKLNFRNTRQIFEVARSILAAQELTDLGGGGPADPYDVELVRVGPWPVVSAAADRQAHLGALVAEVERAGLRPSVRPGDLCILVGTGKQLRSVRGALAAAGIESGNLEHYQGRDDGERVWVGTYKRAKGLEMKHVFMPFLDAQSWNDAPAADEDDAEWAERRARQARELFVGATRARDRLWLGWAGEPTALIAEAVGLIEHETAS